ncbi:hypothetical protein ABDD95_19295 [Mucilaginibacter sp. PAMB04274]|uniref:hypothetical protein n=1 Tax=Mucilaginibacter sp. PAMB04274 TaxID=3138568 RepID=UPI0031F68C42
MDELTGTLVLVHPQLPSDPAKKQGQIGIITSADLGRDDVFVSFGKGEQALYATDALMVLKNPDRLYRDLIANFKELEKNDFKMLFQINLLQQHGNSKQVKTAMELALGNDIVLKHAMNTLDDHLGIKKSEVQEQQRAPAAKIGR